MSAIYKWRVWCNVDVRYEYIWSEYEPIKCPIDSSHAIASDKSVIIDKAEQNYVEIKEDLLGTGGNFKCESKVINTAAKETLHIDYTWPFDISVLSIHFNTDSLLEGDIVNISINPDNIIDEINTKISSNIITVSESTINLVKKGYYITITNEHTDNLGRIISINKSNNTITTENAPNNIYLKNSTTYIKQTIKIIDNFEIGPTGRYVIGDSKIGGCGILANSIVRVSYTNSGISNHKFIANIEYLY